MKEISRAVICSIIDIDGASSNYSNYIEPTKKATYSCGNS